MWQFRPAQSRGHSNHGWLDSWHSFSFADYFDPQAMGWGNLRVINDDRVAPGEGFGTHGHRDMEIVSYVLSGALSHRDSMGHVQTIPAGDVQRMSAGRGVRHSEFNHDADSPVHFLQIWLLPQRQGIDPGYEQATVSAADKRGRLYLLAAPPGQGGRVDVHADARLYAACLDGDEQVEYRLPAGRKAYVHVARGALHLNGQPMGPGDGMQIADEAVVIFSHGQAAEVLLFDLAP